MSLESDLKALLAAREQQLERSRWRRGWQLFEWLGWFRQRFLVPLLPRSRDAGQACGFPADLPRVEQFGPARDRFDVVVFPVMDWEYPTNRPQHFSREFAAAGHRVFYLRASFGSAEACELGPGVYGVRLPGDERLDSLRDRWTDRSLQASLRGLDDIRARATMERVVCLVTHPFWGPLAEQACRRWGWRLVYDCVDEHSAFPGAVRSPYEAGLLEASELVSAPTPELLRSLSPQPARGVVVPNATEFEHFHERRDFRPLAGLPGPILGYHGEIAGWFDAHSLWHVARARPSWQFVLIGPTQGYGWFRLKSLSNVHLLGPVPYSVLPCFAQDYSVGLIPFLRTPLTNVVLPIKFFEYLAAGKPVVSSALPPLQQYAPLVRFADSPEQWLAQLETALERGAPPGGVDLARRATWARCCAELAAHLGA